MSRCENMDDLIAGNTMVVSLSKFAWNRSSLMLQHLRSADGKDSGGHVTLEERGPVKG